ncbi:cupin domain-containing protein [Acidothermaceae bacterium B102]|nr:cupin domain-containing protein [Acidothermaceae bacterium B102]
MGATLDEDNERVRITTWSFAGDGDATGPHVHELDYVVVPLTGGTLTVVGADGSHATMEQVAGSPYFRPAGAAHDVVNASGRAVSFVEIELKV